MKKVSVMLDEDVVRKLIKMKDVGESYSDVLRRILNEVE